MVNKKLKLEHVAQVRALLALNWPAQAIIKNLADSGVSIGRSQVYWIKNGQHWRENSEPSPSKPGPRRVLSERQVRQFVEIAKVDNPPTQQAIARKFGVSRQLIQLEIKRNDLKRLKKPSCHQLTEATREKRRQRSWPLYLRLNNQQWQNFIIVDEALFYIDENGVQTQFQYVDKFSDRSELLPFERKNFPKSVMAFVGISSRGPSKVFFVEPGAKINADYYITKVLKPFFKDVHQRLFPDENFIFHQDSAPAHAAKKTIEYLRSQNISFISPEEWLPNSPDAAPCDFFLWGFLKNQIRKMKVTSERELKNAIRLCVRKVPQNMIDNALKSWPKRLRKIYEADGGHIENRKSK